MRGRGFGRAAVVLLVSAEGLRGVNGQRGSQIEDRITLWTSES